MKRKILIITALFLILTGSFSCKQKEESNEFITMQVFPKEVSINSLNKLRIENHTKKDISYGSPFCLEYFYENEWIAIQHEITWEDIGYILKAGETTENRMNLYALIEEFNGSKKGKYRIIKTFSFMFKQQDEILHAEFENN